MKKKPQKKRVRVKAKVKVAPASVKPDAAPPPLCESCQAVVVHRPDCPHAPAAVPPTQPPESVS